MKTYKYTKTTSLKVMRVNVISYFHPCLFAQLVIQPCFDSSSFIAVWSSKFPPILTLFSSFFLIPYSLINADFCCAGSLIAYGALLGKVSPVQLLVVTLFGVTLFAVEEYIILTLLHVSLIKHNHPVGDFIIVQGVGIFLQTLHFFPLISFLFLFSQCRDAGGSMVIHAFGGYYGLAISWVLYRPDLHLSKRLNGSVYHSDVFAMIGE